MNFESTNFMQFDLPFTLDSLALVDIVDSSIDVKENDIVFISTKNEEDCQKFVAESIEKTKLNINEFIEFANSIEIKKTIESLYIFGLNVIFLK